MMSALIKYTKPTSKNSSYTNRDSNTIQLPNINNTGYPKQSSSEKNFKNRIDQITKNMDYQNMSNGEINQQYKKLKQILQQINLSILKILDKARFEPSKQYQKVLEPKEMLEIKDKQIQNNNKTLQFYKLEYLKIRKRFENLNENSKYDLEKQIKQVEQKIDQTTQQIKELKKKNTSRSNEMLDGDVLVRQIKKLKFQLNIQQQKRNKIQNDLNNVSAQNIDYKNKLNLINDKYLTAQKYSKEVQKRQNQEKSLKKNQMILFQRKFSIDAIKKKIQNSRLTNQHKYLIKLKDLQSRNQNIKTITTQINHLNINIQQNHKIIKQLQAKIKGQPYIPNFQINQVFITKVQNSNQLSSIINKQNSVIINHNQSQKGEFLQKNSPKQINQTQPISQQKIKSPFENLYSDTKQSNEKQEQIISHKQYISETINDSIQKHDQEQKQNKRQKQIGIQEDFGQDSEYEILVNNSKIDES